MVNRVDAAGARFTIHFDKDTTKFKCEKVIVLTSNSTTYHVTNKKKIKTFKPVFTVQYTGTDAPSGTCSELQIITTCPQGSWGDNCTQTCSCVETNTDTCNPVDGVCSCKSGWGGGSCNTDINECNNAAIHNCPGNSTCQNTDGSFFCQCNVGFSKASDETCQECDDTHYGNDCSQTCSCVAANTRSCDHVDGTCSCNAGWEGTICTDDINECTVITNPCNDPLKTCTNTQGSYECSCISGYRINATLECIACPQGSWGDNCTQTCSCVEANTDTCNPVDGICSCKVGWGGGSCNTDINECNNAAIHNCPGNSTCQNTDGSFFCQCNVGFSKASDGTCQECGDTHYGNDCSQTCSCVAANTRSCDHVDGTCTCNAGWEGTVCTDDINECTTLKNPCNDPLKTCTNTQGSYECSCISGYRINANLECIACPQGSWGDNCSQTCSCVETNTDTCNPVDGVCSCKSGWGGGSCNTDINECNNAAIHNCPGNSTCQNTDGSFFCQCNVGFSKASDETCQECDDTHYGNDCSQTCSCVAANTRSCDHVDGTCTCNAGWEGTICTDDINECTVITNPCNDPLKTCTNTQGSYECSCISGYRINANLECIACPQGSWGDNCSQTCSCVETNTDTCNPVDGICSCKSGWGGGSCNTDINECNNAAIHNCPGNSTCQNTDGSFFCQCNVGFSKASDETCQACPQGSWGDNCSQTCSCVEANTDTCNPVDGVCSCKSGWGGGSCNTDINECNNAAIHNCPGNSTCQNTDGSFFCQCNVGFSKASDGTCQACPQGSWGDNCSQTCSCVEANTDTCNPVDGICSCKVGWGGGSCNTDINECNNAAIHNCPGNSTCQNTDGSFFCQCNVGFSKASDGTCQECDDTHYGNDCSQTCSCVAANTRSCDHVDGTCTCNAGWEGTICTDDINECTTLKNPCNDPLKTCTNTQGSYECSCISGYRINANLECIDFDECSMTNPCLHGGTCTNNIGGYRCICPPEWTGDICETDRNECLELSPCHNGGTCINQAVGYVCECPPGWTGKDCTSVVGLITVDTPSDYNYRVLAPFHVTGMTYIMFEVQACHDVHILLMADKDDEDNSVLEVVIGGWLNTRSVIRTYKQEMPPVADKNPHTPPPLDCDSHRRFWISWVPNSSVRVGTGNYNSSFTGQFLVYEGSNVPHINYVRIATWWDVVGHWILDVDECMLTPPVCQNGGSCYNSYGSFVCQCLPEWTGSTCLEEPLCGPEWVWFRDYCYSLVEDPLTWDEAQDNCGVNGGFLARVPDIETDDFLKTTFVYDTQYDEGWYWLGASDRSTEGTFVWEGPSPNPIFNGFGWLPEEPNGGTFENCVDYLNTSKYPDFGWNDEPCWTTWGSICQRPVKILDDILQVL